MKSPLQEKLHNGDTVLGVWSIISDATLVEIGAAAGLDFHILDLEHGTFDIGTLEQSIRAAEYGGSAPLVRVPDLTPSTFQRVLDLGAHGIIAPQVRSAHDAEQVVRYAKYAPRGVRGYNPFNRAANFAAPPNNRTGKLNSTFGVLGVIIENHSAWKDLDSICKIAEIDLIYLGVYDMSLALGCNGDTTDPKVEQFVKEAAQQIISAGKTLALMARTESEMDTFLKLGCKCLVCGVDSYLAYQALRTPVEYIRKRNGEKVRA
jgi:4-hydroxy-2-oxoheptanedioate aldolase